MVSHSSSSLMRHEPTSPSCCADSSSRGADSGLQIDRASGTRAGLSMLFWVPSEGARWVGLLLGLIALTFAAAALGPVTGLSSEPLLAGVRRILASVAKESWSILPYFLLSVAVSAWAQATSFSRRITAVFERHERFAVPAATVVGSTVPLCACSVIPLIAALLAAGAPLGPVMAFLISAPLMSPAIFLITTGTLGISYAVARLLSALALGAAAGYLVSFLTARNLLRDQLRASALPRASCCEIPKSQNGDGVAARRVGNTFWSEARRVSLFLGKWLLVAFFLQALIEHYVDPAWIRAILGEGNALAIPLATALGIPLYISGVAGMPFIQGLVSNGMAPGAALAFLVAGPVTSISAMIAVQALVRPRVFAIYLGCGVGGSLVAGYAFQFVIG